MLLSCCFRSPAKKKHKKNKNWKAENTEDDEEFYSITKSLLSSEKEEGTKTIKKSSTQERKKNDRKSVSSEIHQKLQKEKEELKVQRQSFVGTVPVVGNKSSSFKNGIIDPTIINIIPQDVSRMFASAEDLEGSLLSLSSAHQSLQISSQSLVPNSDQETTPDEVIPGQPTQDDHHKKETEVPPNSNANNNETVDRSNKTKNVEEPKEVNVEQVEMKERERKEMLKKHIDESEKIIKDMKHHHSIELEKVQQSYDVKLNEMKAEMMKNLEIANIEAKNMANETISKLNKQVIQERGKILAEQQENSKQLQEEFRLKNEQLNQSLRDIEERETSWQEERQDVLNEVQRLKADATRMAKLLAMEYEDDNCLGNKKRSLSQEVYSLQLVVEMRTGEVRNMREQMAKASQQLEQAEMDKEKLRKVTARVEDLEEQLRIKNCFERQLSLEKSQLEKKMSISVKEADRMSKTMESLRWRIQNNFQFPVENISAEKQGAGLSTNQPDNLKSDSDNTESTLDTENNIVRQRREAVTAISGDAIKQVDDKQNEPADTGDNLRNISKSEHLDINIESEGNEVDDLIDDVESLDEGVGDISSDGENHDRVSIDNTNAESLKNEATIIDCDKEATKEKKNISPNHEKERIPSIF